MFILPSEMPHSIGNKRTPAAKWSSLYHHFPGGRLLTLADAIRASIRGARRRPVPASSAVFILLGFLFATALMLRAQSDLSGISGTITDASGAVISGANVTVTDEATGTPHKTTTNGSGYYTMPSLSPGKYTIVVEAASFATLTSTGNNLDPSVSTTANLRLNLGST